MGTRVKGKVGRELLVASEMERELKQTYTTVKQLKAIYIALCGRHAVGTTVILLTYLLKREHFTVHYLAT